MTKHNGAHSLVQGLVQAGVKQIFTLSGNHIMPVFDACLDAGITLIHTRHEAAAVHMADAWARLTGEVGVALVTGGPGHANAVSALYTAQMAESPVLLLSGHAPCNQIGMGAFQEMRQADMAAPVCKAASNIDSASAIQADLQAAVLLARSGRPGPVHVSLPTDVLEAACHAPLVLSAADFLPTPQAMDGRMAQSVMHALQDAKRPLILTGPAGMSRTHWKGLLALQASSQIPVVGMQSPRGINDPSLGAFAEALAQADCILLLGKRLDFTLGFGKAPGVAAQCTWLQLDADQGELDRTQRAVGDRLRLSAQIVDVGSAVSALTAAMGATTGAPHAMQSGWLAEVHAAVRYRPSAWATVRAAVPDRLHPAEMFAPVQSLLDSHPDSVLVSDGGEIGQWAQACLSAPNRVLNGVAGSIGSALPFALAARLAKPGVPVVAVLGDGTFGFHASEIDTAVRYKLPFVAIVGNDARWNAEHQIQLRSYGADRTIGCELLPTRYDLVTQAFGGHGQMVTNAADMAQALQTAHQSNQAACINVMIEGLAAPNLRRPVSVA